MSYLVFAFLSALCYGTGQVIIKKVLESGMNPVTATAFGAVVSAGFTLLICIVKGVLPTKALIMSNVGSFIMISIFGIIMVTGTVLANTAMSYPEGKVAVVTIISLVGAIVLATILAFIFLGEELSLKIILGLILASAGVILLSL